MKLQDRIAIITGASSGMGRAMALLFAEEGAKVVALARRKEKLDEIACEASVRGQVIVPFTADVSNADDIENVVRFTVEKFGKVDVLVNNAGIMDNVMPLHELSDELWDRIIAVNLTAPMKLTRRVIQEMLKQGSGSIVNVASIGGLNGCRGGAAYVSSKHGVIGMTKNIGYMYADKGIRCNAICPGAVDTEIGASGVNQPSAFGMQKMAGGMQLNPRIGTSEELAAVALFLASDDSSFVNGTAIVADAGWTAY